VLMGRLSPLDGIGPREIGLDVMQRRLAEARSRKSSLRRISRNEGEATAHYISEMLKDRRSASHPDRTRRAGGRGAGYVDPAPLRRLLSSAGAVTKPLEGLKWSSWDS